MTPIEGYHVLVGGGFGPDATLAREIWRDVKATDVPATIERLLKAYLAGRTAKDETFLAFARRHDDATAATSKSDVRTEGGGA